MIFVAFEQIIFARSLRMLTLYLAIFFMNII